jgi:hypothetical protein
MSDLSQKLPLLPSRAKEDQGIAVVSVEIPRLTVEGQSFLRLPKIDIAERKIVVSRQKEARVF